MSLSHAPCMQSHCSDLAIQLGPMSWSHHINRVSRLICIDWPACMVYEQLSAPPETHGTRVLQPLAYMGLHLTLTAATFAVAKIWWNSYHAHTLFLVFVLCMSSWNGASFYFDVFAHRYIAQLGIPPRTPKRMQETNGKENPSRLQDSKSMEEPKAQ